MVSNKMIYQFCKNFVNEYEKRKENINEYELAEMNMTIEEYLENICKVEKAGLQALITDDFVKMLPEQLQEQIILSCMNIKINKFQ